MRRKLAKYLKKKSKRLQERWQMNWFQKLGKLHLQEEWWITSIMRLQRHITGFGEKCIKFSGKWEVKVW